MEYANFNDVWGIKPKPLNTNNTKETFTKKNCCENFSHILSCEKCLKKIKNHFEPNNKNLENKIELLENKIEYLTNKKIEHLDVNFNDIKNTVIDFYKKNKKLVIQIILILLFIIISLMLIKTNKNVSSDIINQLQKHYIIIPKIN